ncbi:MAG: sigma-70 family RNA polymerase sigma factor [Verrucomicrobiota bacterium]
MAQAEQIDRLEDEGILTRVARREPEAMRRCIERYSGLVSGIARKYMSVEADAEDVVQEVFAELWLKAERFDPSRASAATFIGLVARRRSIDWLRKQSRRPKLEPITDEIEMGHTGDSAIRSRMDTEQIGLAMQQLPARTQELFRLHFEKGMTHPEIAKATGLALGTVKTTLRRGLIEMRDRMREREGRKYEVT